MAAVGKKWINFLFRRIETRIQDQPVRHQFVDWKMLKNYRKRLDVKKYGEERIRLTSLKRNKILPPELQAIASEEVAALPRTSCRNQLFPRCIVTSRSRSVVKPYRISRIVFRDLADHSLLAGWERARW